MVGLDRQPELRAHLDPRRTARTSGPSYEPNRHVRVGGRPNFNIAWKDYSWPFYESHLAEMVDLLRRRGIRLAIVVFPFEPQILFGRTMRDRRDEILVPQQHLERLCRKYAVPCLDLYPAFERAYAQGRTLYRDGIHPNQEGDALTADEVLRFLDAERLLPAPSHARGG